MYATRPVASENFAYFANLVFKKLWIPEFEHEGSEGMKDDFAISANLVLRNSGSRNLNRR